MAQALRAPGEHCAGLERNSLCYAHPNVAASFADAADAARFYSPGKRAPLAQLKRIQTAAMDAQKGHWGIAILHLQANLPQTRSGAGALVLLAGGAWLEQEVELWQIDEIRAPISTAARQPTPRFSQASRAARKLGQLRKNEIALVDAKTRAGDWLRVVDSGLVSWVERERMAALQVMDSLPVVDVADAFAMQSFTFAAAGPSPACAAAAPILAIQTPAESSLNLTVNGVDTHFRSLVSFQHVQPNSLRMTAHRGAATTVFGDTVVAGKTIVGRLAGKGEGNGKATVIAWSAPMPATALELARGKMLQDAFNGLARANGWAE